MLSRTLAVLLVVYCISEYSYGQTKKAYFREDYTYIESTEAFYKIHTVSSTWWEAKKKCSTEGALLFYPKDEREAHAVISFWTSSQSFEWVFVGISDLLVKRVFVTVDGVPISNVFRNWAPGEPNDAGGVEDCVVMKKVAHYNDDNCFKKLPFICKKTLKSLQLSPNFNFTNSESNTQPQHFQTGPPKKQRLFMPTMTETQIKNTESNDLFAKFVASELNKFNEDARFELMSEIISIIRNKSIKNYG